MATKKKEPEAVQVAETTEAAPAKKTTKKKAPAKTEQVVETTEAVQAVETSEAVPAEKATKREAPEKAEQASEKICGACGFSNPAEAVFCGNCGKKLEDGKHCRNCGAPIVADCKFCMQCGYPTAVEKACPQCGTKVTDGFKFCPKCGHTFNAAQSTPPAQQPQPVYATPQPVYVTPTAYAPPQPPAGPKAPFRQRVIEHENKHHLITNLVVILLGFIFTLIALFAPIEVAISGIDFSGSGSDGGYSMSDSNGVDQTIFQVFDAYDYIGLDYNDVQDKRIIDSMAEDFRTVVSNAQQSFYTWYLLHQSASEEEAMAKLYEYLTDEMSDMNLLGFMLVLSTQGVYDSWASEFEFEGKESELNDLLICMYNSAVYSLVVATIVAGLQIAIAIMSLVFMIIAICNLVRKKPSKPLTYLFVTLLLSGIGLITTMLAPNLVPTGAVMGLAIMSAIAYIACAMTAFTQNHNYLAMIRHGILGFVGLLAFVVMIANLVQLVEEIVEVGPGGVDWSGSITTGSPGQCVTGLLMFALLFNLNGASVDFAPESAMAMIFAMALGIIATSVMFVMLLMYLRSLGKHENAVGKRLGTWFAIAGAACLLVLAIGSAVIGGLGDLPTSSSSRYTYIKLTAGAAPAAYVSLFFAAVAIIFDFVYSATALKKPTLKAQGGGAAGVAPVQPMPDSLSSNVEQPYAVPPEAAKPPQGPQES